MECQINYGVIDRGYKLELCFNQPKKKEGDIFVFFY